MLAMNEKLESICMKLIHAKANINAVNKDGGTALATAKAMNLNSVVSFSHSLSKSLIELITQHNSPAAQSFMNEHSNQLDFNYRSLEYGSTPLMYAVYMMPEICKQLIEMKTDLNIKQNQNYTALTLAQTYKVQSSIDLITEALKHK
jgi:ankyrin repeat protein